MNVGIGGYEWIILEDIQKAPQYLIDKYGELLAQLIYNRKDLFDKEFSENYIEPTLQNIIHSSQFPSLEEIAFRLAESIKKNKRIVIYGDYDADGITSTALLMNFFKDINYPAKFYIPSRFSEGYGLNKEAIKKISEIADTLIVVDSGTNAYDELLYAKQLGMEVFVLDHHEPQNPEWKEENIYILNPKNHQNSGLFRHLATVGIAFYVIAVLRRLLGKDIYLRKYLDIVAIGTVADVVPLSLLNRIFVKYGIEEINKKHRVGIKKLLEKASLTKREVKSTDIGFLLAPRLNAAGRLSDARKSVKILITDDDIKASNLANELENLNRERQNITERVSKEAIKIIEKENISNSIVVGKEDWHQGVIGIVAGKLTTKYKLPSVVLAINNGKAVASVRSVPKVNIYNALNECADLLERYGGHALAAGFTIKSSNIPEFKERFNQAISKISGNSPFITKEIDMRISLSFWNKEKIKQIEILAPFGEKNPEPKFLAQDLKIEDYYIVEKGRLVVFTFRDINNNRFTAKWWGGLDYSRYFAVGLYADIVYTPTISYWQDREYIEFLIDDMKIYKK